MESPELYTIKPEGRGNPNPGGRALRRWAEKLEANRHSAPLPRVPPWGAGD